MTSSAGSDHDRAPGHGLLATIAAKVSSLVHPNHDPIIYAVTINDTPDDVYAFTRDFAQLPRFMTYLVSVVETGRHSHWIARIPGGETIEWDAELVEDIPGERVAWRTVPGSAHDVRMTLCFSRAPGRDMTEVRVEMTVGSGLVAKLIKPMVKGDLRRLKQVMETGEVLQTDPKVRGPETAQEGAVS
jgi:uncharacterized membrane protein